MALVHALCASVEKTTTALKFTCYVERLEILDKVSFCVAYETMLKVYVIPLQHRFKAFALAAAVGISANSLRLGLFCV